MAHPHASPKRSRMHHFTTCDTWLRNQPSFLDNLGGLVSFSPILLCLSSLSLATKIGHNQRSKLRTTPTWTSPLSWTLSSLESAIPFIVLHQIEHFWCIY